MNKNILICLLLLCLVNISKSQKIALARNHFQQKDSIVFLKTYKELDQIIKKLDKEKKGYFLKAGCCMGGESWGKPSKYKITYIAQLGDSTGLLYRLTLKDKADSSLF